MSAANEALRSAARSRRFLGRRPQGAPFKKSASAAPMARWKAALQLRRMPAAASLAAAAVAASRSAAARAAFVHRSLHGVKGNPSFMTLV